MNYEESLTYIHSLSRFGIKPGLERISAILKAVKDPQDAIACVHVAGTNGKGSTCAFLAAGLAACGYKVGLYTSPYVLCFRERIQAADAFGRFYMISESELADIVTYLAPIADEIAKEYGDVTEFEFITAAAFIWFASIGVDVAVTEVGMGGRWDATNVIKEPLVSVIATVGLDHTEILGDTVAKIAAEKCGIIKENCPVVTTYLQPVSALDVIYSTCESKNCELYIPEERHVEILYETLAGTDIAYFGKKIHVPFIGAHQVANCLTALTAAFVLRDRRGFSIHNDSFIAGILNAFIPARQEILRQSPVLMLDGSHNPDGIEQLEKTVGKLLTDRENSLLIIGMLKDKDVRSSVKKIVPYFERIITVTPQSPRAMTADELCGLIKEEFCEKSVTPMTVETAAEKAVANGGTSVICGSLYLASEIREEVLKKL